MSLEAPRHWGVTAPISEAVSSAHELELDVNLLNTLQELGLFENEHETQKRYSSFLIVFISYLTLNGKKGKEGNTYIVRFYVI